MSKKIEIRLYEVQNWKVTNKLHLNSNKTESLLFDVRNELKGNDIKYLDIGNDAVTFINEAEKLSVFTDTCNKLSMKSHVSHLFKLVQLELRRVGAMTKIT